MHFHSRNFNIRYLDTFWRFLVEMDDYRFAQTFKLGVHRILKRGCSPETAPGCLLLQAICSFVNALQTTFVC